MNVCVFQCGVRVRWEPLTGAEAEFNCRRTNLRGEQFRVLVAEALEAGEGCSFLNVREQFLGR